jgi:Zn-dependent peptidase ImmA (M78 family)
VSYKQVISSLEKGERSLKATELARLGELFHVSPLAILGLQPLEESPSVLWRQPTEERARLDDEAVFLDRCRRYAFLEQLASREPEGLPWHFDCVPSRTSYEKAGEWASDARKALALGDRPSSSLQTVLEHRHGVKIFVTQLKGGSGATYRGSLGDAILVNVGEPPGRRAFSVAHELFHLLTWESTVEGRNRTNPAAGDRIEKLAENFAAALLLPREALEARMPRGKPASWRVVQWVDLAREFGVTVPALAWRLVNMNKLKRNEAEQIIHDPARADAGARAATTEERTLPERYVTLAFKAHVEEEISIGKLAELLETGVGMLRKVLADYGFDLDSDVWQAAAVPA